MTQQEEDMLEIVVAGEKVKKVMEDKISVYALKQWIKKDEERKKGEYEANQ